MTRVLVVEDDETLRALLYDALSDIGCAVDLSDGGVAGMQAMTSQAYDAVILDLNMPDLPGEDVLTLQRYTASRKTRIIVLTGARIDEEHLHSLGADRILAKPFDVDELLSAVAGDDADGVAL